MIVSRKKIGFNVVLCFFVLTSLLSCRPSGVLSSRQMRDILFDLHYADAVLQVAGYNYGHDEALAKYYQSVLDKYGVTQAQFDSSLVWYTDNPQIFDKIYPRVMTRLETARDECRALYEEAPVAQPAIERDLPDTDEIERQMRKGLPYFWPNIPEEREKMQKNAEKFAYVEIFS